jgi:alkanesulfonate monooxygenase SsuD/methylene tetrahydromethanopterin reductase-like flavin-dependent oxidoreductase (luciferase family)
MLEEHLAVVHGLWTEDSGWSFAGEHWAIEDACFVPAPRRGTGRRRPPIIVGGSAGGPRIARLAATWADEYNHSRAEADAVRAAFTRVRAACETRGRDPGQVTCSVLVPSIVGQSAGDVEARLRRLVGTVGTSLEEGQAWLQERRPRMIAGTPARAADQVRAFERAGADRIMFQDLLPRDLDLVHDLGALARAYAGG